jgi:predicted RecA/RadA family phage recombinase
MAKNFLQPGRTLDMLLASDVESGGIVNAGGLIGIAQTDGDIGDTIAVDLEGVYSLAKATGTAWTLGEKLYWHPSPGQVQTTGTIIIGHAAAAAASGDATGKVRLLGVGV